MDILRFCNTCLGYSSHINGLRKVFCHKLHHLDFLFRNQHSPAHESNLIGFFGNFANICQMFKGGLKQFACCIIMNKGCSTTNAKRVFRNPVLISFGHCGQGLFHQRRENIKVSGGLIIGSHASCFKY